MELVEGAVHSNGHSSNAQGWLGKPISNLIPLFCPFTFNLYTTFFAHSFPFYSLLLPSSIPTPYPFSSVNTSPYSFPYLSTSLSLLHSVLSSYLRKLLASWCLVFLPCLHLFISFKQLQICVLSVSFFCWFCWGGKQPRPPPERSPAPTHTRRYNGLSGKKKRKKDDINV